MFFDEEIRARIVGSPEAKAATHIQEKHPTLVAALAAAENNERTFQHALWRELENRFRIDKPEMAARYEAYLTDAAKDMNSAADAGNDKPLSLADLMYAAFADNESTEKVDELDELEQSLSAYDKILITYRTTDERRVLALLEKRVAEAIEPILAALADMTDFKVRRPNRVIYFLTHGAELGIT